MGAGPARCCNVSTPDRKGQQMGADRGGGAGSKTLAPQFVMKPIKEYKREYKEKGTIGKSGKVLSLTANDHNGRYVCRKLEMSEMPCQGMADLNAHFQVLNNLEHPHICKFVDAFEDRQYVHMIYDRASPMTLFEHIRAKSTLTEEEAADYLRQAAMAMSVAHSQGVVHGRFSPKSLILADEEFENDDELDTQIKICDLGQAFILKKAILDEKESEKTLEVEKYAISPEIAQEEFPATSGTAVLPKGAEKNDIWAMGVVFYHMLSGTTPFRVADRKDLVTQMSNKTIKFSETMWSKLSSQARDLIEQMMRLTPSIRISAAHILKHPWVKVARATFPRSKMLSIMADMRNNVEECEFKQFVLRVIAEQLPNDGKHVMAVENMYRCLDRNGDGILSIEEVVTGLKKHLQQAMDEQDIEELFARLDRDGSHTINVQEFVTASIPQARSTSLPVLWEAFCAFDKDQSGFIAFDEIDRLVREIEGAVWTKDQMSNLCKEIRRELEAVGSSGGIDFDQFVYTMKNSNPNWSDAIAKDWNRMLWNACGVDNYNVRHTGKERWKIDQNASPRSKVKKKGRRRNSDDGPDEAG